MRCIIESEKTGACFEKHLFEKQNHWVSRIDAKIFESVKEAREIIKKNKLKKVKVVKL